jgi:hypothetical protein
MAEDPPESIFVGQFSGLKNAVNQERLKPEELAFAFNIDLDNEGQVRRREGYAEVARGDFHSLYTAPSGRTFAVNGGWLGRVTPDFDFHPIAVGGDRRMAYVEIDETLYFCSPAVSGKLTPDLVAEPWGQIGGAAEWFSPVVNPTETLPEVNGVPLSPPPLGRT